GDNEDPLGTLHSMAASRSTRVTRSTVGLNGLDENFCGRTLRNRSIAHPEEVSAHPQIRSRSPKKRPEAVQAAKGSSVGRAGDLKQQSARESWVSPRKRGLSASEKDSDKQAGDNCDRKQAEPVSPVLKRIKRCLRSEAPNSSEEDSSPKGEKEPLEHKSSAPDNDGGAPGNKRACRCLVLDDCDKREVKKLSACGEGVNSSAGGEELGGYQALNGVGERDLNSLNCDDCDGNGKPGSAGSCPPKDKTVAENGNSFAPSSLLLQGRQEEGGGDREVPCTDSPERLKSEESGPDRSPEEPPARLCQPAPGSESQPSLLRDSEEEVDVVGDSSASKEQRAELPPGSPRQAEPRSPAPDAPVSELQEHRYTLRTSPRRAAPARSSPPKNNSPWRENGQPEDNTLSAPGGLPHLNGAPQKAEDIQGGEKERSCHGAEPGAEGLRKPLSEARLAKESANSHPAEDEEEEPDVYYFESDHVALKHNKDYQRLLQTIAVLEAQRTQAVQDLECLGRHQREALKDPIGFVERLQKQVDMGLPYPQRVVQLPEISWDQYTSSLGNFEREFKNRKRNSRRVKLIFDKVGIPARPKSPLDPKKDGEAISYSVLPLSDGPEGSTNSRPQQMIRGRLCDETKPETFNQLWTVEEQKKLEQLLLKYPPEEVESRRWQKIADELGNRTAKQVASRVQKYFIKLTKAGIPVPGRTPNLYLYSKKSSSRRQHPLNKHLFKPSTFMTSHEPPVYMDEDDERCSFHSHMEAAAEEEVSDEESIPITYRELPEYKELLEFKKLKKQKLQQLHAESGFVQHVGFKCDNCGTEPIQGVRWHCQDCPQEMSLDFCDSCSDCLHETEIHKEDHQLEPIYRAETFLDRDYCMSQGTSYNYLDPNYFPANR
ncbi:ZZZ3 protein, partial [Alcedo cyanopectus]|nr:ZZZ3 protein [Ceyx cyanopectus]